MQALNLNPVKSVSSTLYEVQGKGTLLACYRECKFNSIMKYKVKVHCWPVIESVSSTLLWSTR